MADKKQQKVYLIPEGETRDHHTYHYTAIKTRKFILENKKMKLKKFNPVKRVHEWFVEAKAKSFGYRNSDTKSSIRTGALAHCNGI